MSPSFHGHEAHNVFFISKNYLNEFFINKDNIPVHKNHVYIVLVSGSPVVAISLICHIIYCSSF